MNKQKYAKLYAQSFHGANQFSVLPNGTIQYRLYDEQKVLNQTLKLKSLNHFILTQPTRLYSYPLVKALETFLNLNQALASVFHNEYTWAVLLGDRHLIFPQENGEFQVSATSYFVHRIHLEKFHKLVSKYGNTHYDGCIYNIGNMIIYLDPYDIIMPGTRYFDSPAIINEWFRICFLTRYNEPLDSLENILQVRNNPSFIKNMPCQKQSVETGISSFLPSTVTIASYQPKTIHQLHENYRDIHHSQSYKKPRFILQDVLESYSQSIKNSKNNKNNAADDDDEDDDNLIDSLGVWMEAPVLLSYDAVEYQQQSFHQAAPHVLKFHALVVNGTLPRKYLYVPMPYDRYYEYSKSDHLSLESWTPVLYRKRNPVLIMSTVVWDGDIIGYVYKDVFFCLPCIMLGNNPSVQYRNLDKIFNLINFNIGNCDDLIITNELFIGQGYKLYTVKHKQWPHVDLYGLHKKKKEKGKGKGEKGKGLLDGSSSSPDYKLPTLVTAWINFLNHPVVKNRSKVPFSPMNLVPIMTAMTKHEVCFNIEEIPSNKPKQLPEVKLDDGKVIFSVKYEVREAINFLRLKNREEKKDGSNNNDGDVVGCCII